MNKKSIVFFMAVILSVFSHFSFAQIVMCGKDLRPTFDPQTLDELAKAGRHVKNGYGRFWKIEKPGVAPSWLLGTMHAGDSSIVKMTTAEMQAFHQAQRVVLELSEVTDKTDIAMMKTIMASANLLMYKNDDNLKKHISDEQFQRYEAALKKRGIAYSSVQHMRPWFLWLALSLPQCAAFDNEGVPKPLDIRLGLDALRKGKKLVGLETVKEQIMALATFSDLFYTQSIIEVVENEALIKDQFTTMGKLYSAGKIGEIMALFDYYSKQNMTAADLQKFNTILINQRNVIMAKRVEPLLKKGNNFIALGALHLVGDKGLIEAFRKMGYQVTPEHYE